jgi:hypothetical protein
MLKILLFDKFKSAVTSQIRGKKDPPRENLVENKLAAWGKR